MTYSPMEDPIKNIVIFASGAGSNAQKIIDYFKENKKAQVVLIVCNNEKAGVLSIASRENIPLLAVERKRFYETGYIREITSYKPDIIVLAGFLWKIPEIIIHSFPSKIINIHPALLPAFGGKGMYGMAVHRAVIGSKAKESGITIHFVDEKYDHGKIILQEKCAVDENETPESLANKIHQLEHKNYAKTINELLMQSD